jgi:pimeloyl-ACP methyl ester carboxylesterase
VTARRIAIGLAGAALLGAGTLLIPPPPQRGNRDPRDLARPGSRFIDVGGVEIHHTDEGIGEPAYVLVHGFGANLFTYHSVRHPLAHEARVITFDRPGFGLTSRPMPGTWGAVDPYTPEGQATLLLGLLDRIGVRRAVLVGHSQGAAVAALAALAAPERVAALVLADPLLLTGGGVPGAGLIERSPWGRRIGPWLAHFSSVAGEAVLRRSYADPARITPYIVESYYVTKRCRDWERAIWELWAASHPLKLGVRLRGLEVPTALLWGARDELVPAALHRRLAGLFPQWPAVELPGLGHVAQEEDPPAFIGALHHLLWDRLGIEPGSDGGAGSAAWDGEGLAAPVVASAAPPVPPVLSDPADAGFSPREGRPLG